MGSQRKNQCLTMIIFVAIQNLGNIQSLQRAPVPPSSGSPCTHTPGLGSGGHCPLGEMNFAGHIVAHAPPAFPDAIVNFSTASVTNNETQKQDSSS
ncbi:hypothetical protein POPTR_019G012603v4 [Populus trichocarpa]|uniref:Uncharacterized protein n=1 Tax=Populus trichocarpa TaxID=3694 RepID=A0ACC0RIQ1_POPTR|nr:hypothetical protein POPTR_019G012603v4 [Populus trichocarpa]